MKVILNKDVPSVGRKHEIKDVNDGFARNFLFRKKLAVQATEERVKALAQQKIHKDERTAAEREKYQQVADTLKSAEVIITVKAGEKGKAFGSVNAAKIVESLKKQGIELDKDRLDLEGPIKTTGVHDIGIKFPYDIKGEIKVIIKAEE